MSYEKIRNQLLKERTELIDKCQGCSHTDGKYCKAYAFPDKKWKNGDCNFASHIFTEEEKKKIRVGQQKQKRRNRKG